jgi:hypothetical protein
LYASRNIIRVIKSRRVRWAGQVAHMLEMWNAYKILIGNKQYKRLLGRPGHRWEGRIRMDLREIGWEGMDWILLAQDRDQWRAAVNTVMDVRVTWRAENFSTSWVTLIFMELVS